MHKQRNSLCDYAESFFCTSAWCDWKGKIRTGKKNSIGLHARAPTNYIYIPKIEKDITGRHFSSDDVGQVGAVDQFFMYVDPYKEGIHMLYPSWPICNFKIS